MLGLHHRQTIKRIIVSLYPPNKAPGLSGTHQTRKKLQHPLPSLPRMQTLYESSEHLHKRVDSGMVSLKTFVFSRNPYRSITFPIYKDQELNRES